LHDQPGRHGVVGRIWERSSAPLFGSSFLFPTRFDRAVETLANGRRSVVPIEYALRYFGKSLHFEIDPMHLKERIADYVRGDGGVRWMGTSFLDSASWDDVLAPIAFSPIHREMREIVVAGDNFRDTRAYRHLVRAIEVRKPGRRNGVRLETIEEVEAYFRYCRDIIKSMRKRGVVRRSTAGPFHRLRLKHRFARSPLLDSTERDVGIAIAADGKLVRHLGGKHRTAIAQALKLPTIPVEVRLIHVDWLTAEMQRTGLPAHRALPEGVARLVASLDRHGTAPQAATFDRMSSQT
jgi:hypothetical protein